MLRSFTYLCMMMIIVVSALGQQLSKKPSDELRLLLQESKQDSNRIEILYKLGRTYLEQVYSDKKQYLMDTAIDIFNHAIRLSDTLQLKNFRYESMLLEGEAYFVKENTAEGKKRFLEVVSIYHANRDIEREARTWFRMARKMNTPLENYSEIETCFDKALKLYKQAHNVEREAAVRTYFADYLFVSGRSNLAEKQLMQALDLLHQIGNTKLSQAYLLLSMINRYRVSYEKSLFYATKCVENAELNKDTAGIDMYYGELALVYDELGRTEESIYWYRKALEKRIEQKTDRVITFRTAGFLIRQLIKLRKSRDALVLIESVVAAYPPQTPFEKAIIEQNLAYCFDALKQYPKAEKYFLAMAEHYKQAPYYGEIISIANMDIGKFYLHLHQFEKAHTYLDTALAHALSGRLSDRRELFLMLFTADSALGNYLSAIKNLQQYQVLNDSIFNDRKSKQIEELTMQYKTEKKEQSIKLLEKEGRLQQNKLTQAQHTRSWILGAVVLLIIIVGLLVNYSRLKQRTNKKLQAQQREIEKKNGTLQHLVDEKEWLVKEIHHRVKNNFHIVQGLLGTQSGYLKSEEAINALADSRHRVQAMSLIHQKLYQSDSLSAINMADYIHELTNYLRDSLKSKQSIQFNLQVDPIELDLSHCIPLGLILNEAITNAIKYAFPGNRNGVINVLFKRTMQNHLMLVVSDNGIGIPKDFNIENPVSMGMRLMRGLSDDIDAKFYLSSREGTEIKLEFIFDNEVGSRHNSNKTELASTI